MLDLNSLPAYYISQYGADKVAEVIGKSSSLVAMWMNGKNGKKFPLDAVAKLVDFDPAPLSAIQPLYTNPPAGKDLMILVPLSGPPAPKMVDSLIRLHDRSSMFYERFAFNSLCISRNVLAARFLRSPANLAFWMDGDSLLPAGDANWFREAADLPDMPEAFAGLHAIFRMHVHKKTIVSCCYPSRKTGGIPQFGGGGTPEMRAKVKRGPRNELIERPWSGMGGMLTHRSVFEDIIRVMGDEIKMKPGGIGERFGYEYGFFNPWDGEIPTDDVPFCMRAARAGHKTFVDLAVQCAHVGDRAYTYKDIL